MIITIIAVVTFFFMEFVAWSAHKYVMHGFLWNLHEDHHTRDNHDDFFEKNDYFFIIFAVPGILSLLLGVTYDISILYGIGIGISIYGMAYFFIHDLFIHQRIKVLRNSNNKYLKAIRRAHKMHHKHITKEDGECFGMLLVPFKYLQQEMKKN